MPSRQILWQCWNEPTWLCIVDWGQYILLTDKAAPDKDKVSSFQQVSDLSPQPFRNRLRDTANTKQMTGVPHGLFFRYSSMLADAVKQQVSEFLLTDFANFSDGRLSVGIYTEFYVR